jgi:branched-chain amino acid transport system ATP-binding protein
MTGGAILEITGLVVAYGRAEAVIKSLDLTIDRGEALGLVGMNGAGKSTLLRAISGQLHPRAGRVLFEGEDISSARLSELPRKGLVLLPEGHRVLRNLTVRENLEIATMALRPAEVRRRLNETLPLVHEMFPVLADRSKQVAGLMSGGEQQMLSISRALIQKPKLLLLDEPSLGLAPLIIDRIYESLSVLRERGIAMLIVEQNSDRVVRATNRMVVLRDGSITAEGESASLDASTIHAAYF